MHLSSYSKGAAIAMRSARGDWEYIMISFPVFHNLKDNLPKHGFDYFLQPGT
jgi:hypothetical protein